MGIFSKFEDKMEDTVEGAASKMSKAPISPVQIAKKAEKQMRRETMVGAGKEYAPTLYTVLVNPDDDTRLFGYYPTLAGETETYLEAKAAQEGLIMDGHPLVRFIVDKGLKHGKFDVIAEMVAAPIVAQLRAEEMDRYGISSQGQRPDARARQVQAASAAQGAWDARDAWGGQADHAEGNAAQDVVAQGGRASQVQDAWDSFIYGDSPQSAAEQPAQRKPPLPYVPEEEIDRTIDYGEYTFNSEDFEDYRERADADDDIALAYNDPQPVRGAQEAAVAGQQAQNVAANTVAFAGGAAAGAANAAVPNRHAVRARLVDRSYHRPYDLAGTLITLGRESGNNIIVQDINASRRHAELRLSPQGTWVITDLGSMNGTLVNGISVASQPLYPGDVITIGKTEYEFALA